MFGGLPGPPRVPAVLFVLPILLVGASTAMIATFMIASGVVVFPLIVLFAVAAAGRHQRRAALRRGAAAGTVGVGMRHPGPVRRPVPPPPPPWPAARARFDALRVRYAEYECDPMAVLRLPALSDVSVPSTARFVDAFAEAQALETDAPPPPRHAAMFVAAVDRAERAWRAAHDAAERIRLSGLTPEERSSVERVIKLLTTARDSGNDAERLAAYSRARSELAKLDRAGVIKMPRTAQAALDANARGELPGA